MIADKKILTDLRDVIQEGSHRIELEDGWIKVESDVSLEIITLATCEHRFPEMEFGRFKACVAIGGVSEVVHGIPVPVCCFALMYYDAGGELITIDFSKSYN